MAPCDAGFALGKKIIALLYIKPWCGVPLLIQNANISSNKFGTVVGGDSCSVFCDNKSSILPPIDVFCPIGTALMKKQTC